MQISEPVKVVLPPSTFEPGTALRLAVAEVMSGGQIMSGGQLCASAGSRCTLLAELVGQQMQVATHMWSEPLVLMVDKVPPGLPPAGSRSRRSSVSFVATTIASSAEADLHHGFCWRRAVVMRNIPNKYTRDMLLALIDAKGFRGCYNFLYLPIDFSSKVAVGYAFVSFDKHVDAKRFAEFFHGFREWAFAGSNKVCSIDWSQGEDGLDAHVRRFRNNSVMHPSVPEGYRPVLFAQGTRIPFPRPTRTVKKPRRGEAKRS